MWTKYLLLVLAVYYVPGVTPGLAPPTLSTTSPPIRDEFPDIDDLVPGLDEVKGGFCEYNEDGLPRKDGSLLDTPRKLYEFESKIHDNKTKELFQILKDANPIIDFASHDMDGVGDFLEVLLDYGEELLNRTLELDDLTEGEGFYELKRFVIDHPEVLRFLKVSATKHIFSNLSHELLGELCENLDNSHLPEASLSHIVRDFPQCVVLAREENRKGNRTNFRQGRIILERIRQSGEKLTIYDLGLDPHSVMVADIDGLSDSDFRDLAGLYKLMRLMPRLEDDVKRKIAHRLTVVYGSPSTWTKGLQTLAGQTIMFLPGNVLKKVVTDEMLELFLNGYYILNKDIVAFMLESLYAKRNTASFHKRFCLSLHHHPYVTMAFLGDFTDEELWHAIRKCQRVFSEVVYKEKLIMRYSYKNDDDEDDDEDESWLEEDDDEDEETGDYIWEAILEEARRTVHQYRPLLKRIYPDRWDATNLTQLHEMAIFIPAFPGRFWKYLPMEVFMGIWPSVQNIGKFPMNILHELLGRLGEHFQGEVHYNASTLHFLGQIVLVLPCSEYRYIPGPEMTKFVLTGFFQHNAHFPCEYNPYACRKIASVALEEAPRHLRKLVVRMLGPLGQYLDTDDFYEEEIFTNEYFPESVKKEIFKRVKDEQKKKIRDKPSKFEESDGERILKNIFEQKDQDDDDDGKKKRNFIEALYEYGLEKVLNDTSLEDIDFSSILDDDEDEKNFNLTYLKSIDFRRDKDLFAPKFFGDIEEFRDVFNISIVDILGELLDGNINFDNLDFDEEDDDHDILLYGDDDFVEELPENEESLEYLKNIQIGLREKAENKGGAVKKDQLTSGFKLVKKIFQLDERNKSDICLDDGVIDSLGCFFTRASKSDLKHLSNKTRKSILVAEGHSYECVGSMHPDEVCEHFETLLDVDYELRDAEEWDEDLLMKHGSALLCGMDEEHARRLTPGAAIQFSDRLLQCRQLRHSVRQAVCDKIKEYYDDDLNNAFKPPYIVDAAVCLMYVDASELKSMTQKSKYVFVALSGKILYKIHDHLQRIEEEYFSVEDVVEEHLSFEDLARAIWDLMEEMDLPTVDRLAVFPDFKFITNTDFLSELSKEDFEEAIEFLAKFDDWTDAQKRVLGEKIEDVYEGLSNLTDFDLSRLGGLVSAVVDDFDKISLDECSLDNFLDHFDDNEDLFEDVCERLTTENAVNTIKKHPQAVCCLNETEARDVNATLIIKVLKNMDSKCHPCLKRREGLLKELSKVMADYLLMKYPDSQIPTDVFEHLKCLAGKLPDSFLESLPVDRLKRLDPDAIELMDPKIFCKVAKKEFLCDSTSLQFQAIDDAKSECMSNEQFECYLEVIEGDFDDEYDDDDDDEEFPDFSKTEIGDSSEFDTFLSALSEAPTQAGDGNANVKCVSTRGANTQELTDTGKQNLRGVLDGYELDLFNELLINPYIDLSHFGEAEITELLEEVNETFGSSGYAINFTQFVAELPTLLANPSVGDNEKILDEVFEHLHPQVYTMIEPTLLCVGLKKLKKNHLEMLCGRMSMDDVSSHTFLTINSRCPVCFTFWVKQRKEEKFYNVLDRKRAAAFFALHLRQQKPLDLYALALGPEGITPEIIQAINIKSFSNIPQLTALTHPNVAQLIPKNSIRLIIDNVIKALGPISKWSKPLKSRLRFFLFHLSRKELQTQLTPAIVIDIVFSREGLEDPEVRRILGCAVNKYIISKSSLISKDILESPQVFCLQLSAGIPEKLLDRQTSPYDIDFLLSMASECREYYEVSPSASRKFFRVILDSISRDEETLEKMKGLLEFLSSKDIKKFSKQALKSLWPAVKEREFDEFQLRIFWDALKDEFLTIDCSNFEDLGQLIRVLPKSALENGRLYDCLDDVMETAERENEYQLPKNVRRGLWSMVMKVLKGKRKSVSDFLQSEDFPFRFAPLIPKSAYDKLDWDLSDERIRARAFKIAEYINDEESNVIGNLLAGLNLEDPRIQKEIFENEDVARIIFSSFDDIDDAFLENGDSDGEILEELAEDVEHMSTRTLEKNFELLKKRIDLKSNCKKETICMDEGQARLLGPLFLAARPDELECLTKKTLRIIMESIGQNNKLCKRMTTSVIQNLLLLVNPTQTKDEGEDLEILYGCMICGFTKAQIQNLDDEQVVLLQDTLSRCHQFQPDVKSAILSKILKYYGGFSKYLLSNPDIGISTLLMHVPVADIKRLDEESLQFIIAAMGEITHELTEELADLLERRDRAEITTTKYDEYFELVNEVLAALYNLIQPSNPARRRKRAAVNSDEQCDILEDFNGNLCFLTESQVNALSNDAVRDCGAQFQNCDYSEAIFTLLATKAKTALGDVSTWETYDYATLGKLLGYMGESTINQMEITEEVIEVIPKVIINDADLIFNQYLSHNNKSLTNLTAEDIADNALLLGSLSATELNALDPYAVGEAVETYDLGQEDNLKELDEDVVELFTNKLIESNVVNFTSSSSSDISNLGVLAGKLPENILKDLSTDQKSGIDADAFSLIEPEILASSFTATDLINLSSEQANAISQEQRDELSEEQRQAVEVKSTVVVGDGSDDDDENHVTAVSASCGLLVTLVLTSLCIIRRP